MNHELLKGLALGIALAHRPSHGRVMQIDELAFWHGEDARTLLGALGKRDSVISWLESQNIPVKQDQMPHEAIVEYLYQVGVKMRGIKNAQKALVDAKIYLEKQKELIAVG